MSQQKCWDFGIVDRNSDTLDDQLAGHNIAPSRRAVIVMLISHHSVAIDQETKNRELSISQRDAADWCREFAAPTKGTALPHSCINRAIQFWCDQGVVQASTPYRGATKLTLSLDRLRSWFDLLPDPDELPIFAPVAANLFSPTLVPSGAARCSVVPSGAARCSVVPSGAARCSVVPSGAPHSMNERMNESIIHSDGEPQEATPEAKPAATTSPAADSLLTTLPELPIGVWEPNRGDRALGELIQSWWAEHGLNERLGPNHEKVGYQLIGLILTSRKKQNPPAFFSRSKQNPAHWLERDGREFVKRITRSTAPKEMAGAN